MVLQVATCTSAHRNTRPVPFERSNLGHARCLRVCRPCSVVQRANHTQLVALLQKAVQRGSGFLEGVGVCVRVAVLCCECCAHESIEKRKQEKLEAAGGDVVEVLIGGKQPEAVDKGITAPKLMRDGDQ